MQHTAHNNSLNVREHSANKRGSRTSGRQDPPSESAGTVKEGELGNGRQSSSLVTVTIRRPLVDHDRGAYRGGWRPKKPLAQPSRVEYSSKCLFEPSPWSKTWVSREEGGTAFKVLTLSATGSVCRGQSLIQACRRGPAEIWSKHAPAAWE